MNVGYRTDHVLFLLPPLYHFLCGSWSDWGICVRPWSTLSESSPEIQPRSCSEGHTSPAPDCRPHSSCLDPPALRKQCIIWECTIHSSFTLKMTVNSGFHRPLVVLSLLSAHVENRFYSDRWMRQPHLRNSFLKLFTGCQETQNIDVYMAGQLWVTWRKTNALEDCKMKWEFKELKGTARCRCLMVYGLEKIINHNCVVCFNFC